MVNVIVVKRKAGGTCLIEELLDGVIKLFVEDTKREQLAGPRIDLISYIEVRDFCALKLAVSYYGTTDFKIVECKIGKLPKFRPHDRLRRGEAEIRNCIRLISNVDRW